MMTSITWTKSFIILSIIGVLVLYYMYLSLSDFGIGELQRGKFFSDSIINTYWFVREHWLCQNKDGSKNKKVLNN